jgi:hypothetical protein
LQSAFGGNRSVCFAAIGVSQHSSFKVARLPKADDRGAISSSRILIKRCFPSTRKFPYG